MCVGQMARKPELVPPPAAPSLPEVLAASERSLISGGPNAVSKGGARRGSFLTEPYAQSSQPPPEGKQSWRQKAAAAELANPTPVPGMKKGQDKKDDIKNRKPWKFDDY